MQEREIDVMNARRHRTNEHVARTGKFFVLHETLSLSPVQMETLTESAHFHVAIKSKNKKKTKIKKEEEENKETRKKEGGKTEDDSGFTEFMVHV